MTKKLLVDWYDGIKGEDLIIFFDDIPSEEFDKICAKCRTRPKWVESGTYRYFVLKAGRTKIVFKEVG